MEVKRIRFYDHGEHKIITAKAGKLNFATLPLRV